MHPYPHVPISLYPHIPCLHIPHVSISPCSMSPYPMSSYPITVAFRCAYCYELNQARKKKPLQPPPSSSVDHTPAPSTPTTPLKASKHEADHTPKVDVADHTPKEDVTEHVPKQDVTDHTPKQDVTDHTPEENANQTGSTGSERNELEPNAS